MSINYTPPELANDYESVTDPSANLLTTTAYRFTDIFLNGLFKVPVIPIEGLNTIDIENFTPFVDYLTAHWQDVLKHDWRILTTLSFGVLLILALPISAIIYCSVKCCCSKVGQAPKKNDRTLIYSLGSVTGLSLIVCWLAFAWTCGATVEFDHHIRYGLIKSINATAKDAQLYLDNLAIEVKHLAQTDFDLLSESLEDQIDQVGKDFGILLNKTVEDIEFGELQTEAGKISTFVTGSNDNTDHLINDLTQCSQSATEIDDIVSKIKYNSSLPPFDNHDFCQIVGESKCTKFNETIASIDCKLSEFEKVIGATKSILEQAELTDEVVESVGQIPAELKEALDQILAFQQTFDADYATIFKEQIAEIHQYAVEVSESVQNFTDDIELGEMINNLTYGVQDGINGYYDYVIYAGLLTPLILIGIILAILTLGLTCGCVGKSGSTLSRIGGISLFSATMFTLVLGWIVWLLVTVFYLAGALTQEAGCTTLDDPVHSPYYTNTKIPQFLTTKYQEFFNTTEVFDLNATLTGIKNGNSLYYALDIENFFDLNEFDNWQELFNISEVLEDVEFKIDDGVSDIVKVMNNSLDEEQLKKMRENLEPIVSGLDEAMNAIDISLLIDEQSVQDALASLETMEEALNESDNEFAPNFLTQMNVMQESLKTLLINIQNSTDILKEAKSKADEIITAVTNIIGTAELKANDEISILDNIKSLLETATTIVNDTTRIEILDIFDTQGSILITTVDGYIQFSKNYTIDEFGKTGPVYDIYRGVIVSLCDSMVNPFNAYWSGMGVILILLVPVMILSVVLEPLFRRGGPRQFQPVPAIYQRHIQVNSGNHPNQHLYTNPNSTRVQESTDKASNKDIRMHPSQHIYEDLTPPSGEMGVTKYRPEDYFPGYAGKGQKNQLHIAQIRRPTQAFHPGYRRSHSKPKGIGPDGRFVYEIPLVYKR